MPNTTSRISRRGNSGGGRGGGLSSPQKHRSSSSSSGGSGNGGSTIKTNNTSTSKSAPPTLPGTPYVPLQSERDRAVYEFISASGGGSGAVSTAIGTGDGNGTKERDGGRLQRGAGRAGGGRDSLEQNNGSRPGTGRRRPCSSRSARSVVVVVAENNSFVAAESIPHESRVGYVEDEHAFFKGGGEGEGALKRDTDV